MCCGSSTRPTRTPKRSSPATSTPSNSKTPPRPRRACTASTSAPTEGNEKASDKAAGPPTKSKDPKGAPPPPEGKAVKKSEAAPTETPSKDAKAQAAEAKLFASPYETLDQIAGASGAVAPGASPDKGDADPQRLAGALSIDSFRDPFKPIGPGSPDDPVAFDAEARNKAPPDLEPGKTGESENPNRNFPVAPSKTGEKNAAGETSKAAPTPVSEPAETSKAADGAEVASAAKVENEIKQRVEAVLGAGAGPDIEARQTKEGLLISLTDKLDFSMFAVGSAEPRAQLVRAMAAIANVVKATPGHIVVRGYTDARPYRNGAYDNWRLSSDRAQMAYYMLTRGGAEAARFVRVEGYADRALKDPAHPLGAVNRRLEILIEGPKS